MARNTKADVEIEMQQLKERLQKMRNNLTNPSPTMSKVAMLMYKDVLDHFGKTQGDKGSWTPLKYRKGKPLQDTGRLRLSIRPDNTKDTASVGSDLDYAATHNYGRDNIPQRKFLWISKEMREQITKIIGKFSIGDSV